MSLGSQWLNSKIEQLFEILYEPFSMAYSFKSNQTVKFQNSENLDIGI